MASHELAMFQIFDPSPMIFTFLVPARRGRPTGSFSATGETIWFFYPLVIDFPLRNYIPLSPQGSLRQAGNFRCRYFGVPVISGAGILGCRYFGVPVFWDAGIFGCQYFEVPVFWGAGILGCRYFGVPVISGASILGCR